ncbi:MAG: esterase-like activity of phytase family protein, partial [Planctomycetota bacterium]
RKPAAEHEYRLDQADADGKLCAMACLGATTLLVLEQADGGIARLYLADTGFAPVRKTLVADLGPLRPAMIADVYGRGADAGRPLKLEGLAVVDARHVLLANDNDFGVADAGSKAKKKAGPRSCLWLIELSEPLPLDTNI